MGRYLRDLPPDPSRDLGRRLHLNERITSENVQVADLSHAPSWPKGHGSYTRVLVGAVIQFLYMSILNMALLSIILTVAHMGLFSQTVLGVGGEILRGFKYPTRQYVTV